MLMFCKEVRCNGHSCWGPRLKFGGYKMNRCDWLIFCLTRSSSSRPPNPKLSAALVSFDQVPTHEAIFTF